MECTVYLKCTLNYLHFIHFWCCLSVVPGLTSHIVPCVTVCNVTSECRTKSLRNAWYFHSTKCLANYSCKSCRILASNQDSNVLSKRFLKAECEIFFQLGGFQYNITHLLNLATDIAKWDMLRNAIDIDTFSSMLKSIKCLVSLTIMSDYYNITKQYFMRYFIHLYICYKENAG